uniref:Predicted protein n=1 Tax=Hordeum vulgare subsp. vulgare TaxID=112509 RepID=F2EHV1_HORVV|nr:predicted protein [Hordeum vulgare subsp. vulgare]
MLDLANTISACSLIIFFASNVWFEWAHYFVKRNHCFELELLLSSPAENLVPLSKLLKAIVHHEL